MTYGIQVKNDRNVEVFNSNSRPYRLAAVVPLEIHVHYPTTPHWKRYRADITQYFEDDNIFSILLPPEVAGNYTIILEQGRWWAYASFGHSIDTLKILSPRPLLYIYNRSEATGGGTFGIETFDAKGKRTLSSNNPLLQVLEYRDLVTIASPKRWETVWTPVGPSQGRLLVVETTAGSTTNYYSNYTGGGDFTFQGWFVTMMEQNGRFYVQAAEWEQTMGESSVERSYATTLRIAVIAKP